MKSKRQKIIFKNLLIKKNTDRTQFEANTDAKKLILLLLPNFKGSNYVGGHQSYVQGSENPHVLQNQFEGCCIRKRLETTTSTSL